MENSKTNPAKPPLRPDPPRTVKPPIFHFLIELPGTGMGLCWIGGGLKPSKRPGYVWLTSPGGQPVLEVPAAQVYPRFTPHVGPPV